ncbi:MAG TPA: radical SAM protein [Azospirillum sp.]|nr:radical SAM protein [Azospirillum sp.]
MPAAIRAPKVLLLYPPHQAWPGYMCKPNGSLAYPSLGGALLQAGIEVRVFDACVGNVKDDLDQVFYRSSNLPSGLLRTGVSEDRILEEVADADIIGITSIFTDQETMVLSTVRLIKRHFPDKLVVSGGVNARNRLKVFFAAGVDLVCLSEAERTIVAIADAVRRGDRDWGAISGLAFMAGDRILSTPASAGDVVWNLDELPIPAWELLPNERYWKIARPHGGHFKEGQELRYASMMTSLGCVFTCSYCHISGEADGDVAGPIGKFRVKSTGRVMAELDRLRDLGVKQVFIEDDSLFGMKRRGIDLIRSVRTSGFEIFDVNGVNIIHLLRKSGTGNRLEPDIELIELLVESGFKQVALPFESASQRIISHYASSKWNVERCDIEGLIRACKDHGLGVTGNYMIGYPDETREEIEATIAMAQWHRDCGLDAASFMLVIPLPGTRLFDMAIAGGHLSEEYDPDRLNWSRASMVNTLVPPAELEDIRRGAWERVNDSKFVRYKKGMNAAESNDFIEAAVSEGS